MILNKAANAGIAMSSRGVENKYEKLREPSIIKCVGADYIVIERL